jgi:hypothetical protein
MEQRTLRLTRLLRADPQSGSAAAGRIGVRAARPALRFFPRPPHPHSGLPRCQATLYGRAGTAYSAGTLGDIFLKFILPWGLIPRPLGRLKSATPTKIGSKPRPLPRV